jgi:Fe-S-cluster-containing hydrogenase component 2
MIMCKDCAPVCDFCSVEVETKTYGMGSETFDLCSNCEPLLGQVDRWEVEED